MANSAKFFDPKVLAKIGRLELRARMVVEGFISGLHKSPYHGYSVEFADHREYTPGDDPRHIDWKVLARADRVYIKRYEEETNLRSHVLLDSSESMRYGSGALSKYEYAATAAASLAYLLNRQQDAVGITLFDDEVRARVPATTGAGVLGDIATTMESTPPARKTALAPVWRRVAETIPRRGVIIILSDLFTASDDFGHALAGFCERHHEVVVLHILDEAELRFPFEGHTLFKGLEEWPDLLADPQALRRGYLEAIGRFLDRTERECAHRNVEYFRIHTGEALDGALTAVLAARSHRQRARSHRAWRRRR